MESQKVLLKHMGSIEIKSSKVKGDLNIPDAFKITDIRVIEWEGYRTVILELTNILVDKANTLGNITLRISQEPDDIKNL